MVLTIELSEEAGARLLAAAEARGMDVNTYAVVAMEAAAEIDREADEAMRVAGREAIREAAEGLLLTPEQAKEEALAILAARRAERDARRVAA